MSDITFTVGLDVSELDTSEIERRLDEIQSSLPDVASELDADNFDQKEYKALLQESFYRKNRTDKSLQALANRPVSQMQMWDGLDVSDPTRLDVQYFLDKNFPQEPLYEPPLKKKKRRGRPKKVKYDDVGLDEFGADLSSPYSQEGSDAYTRLSLMDARSKARGDVMYALGNNKAGYYDEGEARKAAERYAKLDMALKAEQKKKKTDRTLNPERKNKKVDEEEQEQDGVTKDLVEQNNEYTSQILKLNKIFAILHAVKGLVNSIKEAWNKLKNWSVTTTTNNYRGVSDITKDPEGFGQYGSDRTYKQIDAGLRAYGATAPFSMGAYNSVLDRLANESRNVLMGGKPDEKLVQFVQWMNDNMGTDYNAEDLLAGDERSLVQTVNDMMRQVERYFSSQNFYDQSTVKRRQDEAAVIGVLGQEMFGAIGKNIAVGTGGATLIDKILDKGTSANYLTETDKETEEYKEKLSSLTNSIEKLGKVTFSIVSGPLSKFYDGLSRFIDWFSDRFYFLFKKSETQEKIEEMIEEDAKNAEDDFNVKKQRNPFVLAGRFFKALFNKTNFQADISDVADVKIPTDSNWQNLKSIPNLYDVFVSSLPGLHGGAALGFTESSVLAYKLNTVLETGTRKRVAMGRWYTMESLTKDPMMKALYKIIDDFVGGDQEKLKRFTPESLQKKLDKHEPFFQFWEKYFGEGGAYDYQKGESFFWYNIKHLSKDDIVPWLRNYFDYLNPETTGGRISSAKLRVEGSGKDTVLRVYLDFNSPNGRDQKEIVANLGDILEMKQELE